LAASLLEEFCLVCWGLLMNALGHGTTARCCEQVLDVAKSETFPSRGLTPAQ
jgi:hypothetical protein